MLAPNIPCWRDFEVVFVWRCVVFVSDMSYLDDLRLLQKSRLPLCVWCVIYSLLFKKICSYSWMLVASCFLVSFTKKFLLKHTKKNDRDFACFWCMVSCCCCCSILIVSIHFVCVCALENMNFSCRKKIFSMF